MTIDFLFQRAADILSNAILALLGVAVVVFLWGVTQYVIAQGDETKLKAGRSYMLYGIIGLSVMVSVWGIVNVLIFTVFGETSGGPFDFSIPKIESTDSFDPNDEDPCPSGEEFDPISGACVQEAAQNDSCQGQSCQSGYKFDFSQCQCVQDYSQAQICPSGQRWSFSQNMCVQEAAQSCQSGYVWSSASQSCVVQPAEEPPMSCAPGTIYNPTTRQCE